MSFTNFTSGNSHGFGGEYPERVPGQKLSYTDVFDDPNLPGEIHVTVTLKAVSVGTELHIEQEGIPDAIPFAVGRSRCSTWRVWSSRKRRAEPHLKESHHDEEHHLPLVRP